MYFCKTVPRSAELLIETVILVTKVIASKHWIPLTHTSNFPNTVDRLCSSVQLRSWSPEEKNYRLSRPLSQVGCCYLFKYAQYTTLFNLSALKCFFAAATTTKRLLLGFDSCKNVLLIGFYLLWNCGCKIVSKLVLIASCCPRVWLFLLSVLGWSAFTWVMLFCAGQGCI